MTKSIVILCVQPPAPVPREYTSTRSRCATGYGMLWGLTSGEPVLRRLSLSQRTINTASLCLGSFLSLSSICWTNMLGERIQNKGSWDLTPKINKNGRDVHKSDCRYGQHPLGWAILEHTRISLCHYYMPKFTFLSSEISVVSLPCASRCTKQNRSGCDFSWLVNKSDGNFKDFTKSYEVSIT